MKLIDKDEVVAEIERRVEAIRTVFNEQYILSGVDRTYATAQYDAFKSLLPFLDTLEVKQMDIDKLREELKEAVRIYKPTGNFGWGTLYNIAWHFYELGLKTQKGE